MYTKQRDKITFETLDETDEVFDMSCVSVCCVMCLRFSLDSL